MSRQIKVKAFVCIDENGNYQLMGASSVTELNRGELVNIIESGIKNEFVNTTTKIFQVNIDLPEPKIIAEEKSNEK